MDKRAMNVHLASLTHPILDDRNYKLNFQLDRILNNTAFSASETAVFVAEIEQIFTNLDESHKATIEHLATLKRVLNERDAQIEAKHRETTN